MQVLPPEILQLYIQQVINQTLTSMAASGEDGDDSDGESAVTANALQVSIDHAYMHAWRVHLVVKGRLYV